MNLEDAIDLYKAGKVSLGRAANLAGLHFDEFIEECKERKIPLNFGPSSKEEADKELKTLEKFEK